MPAGTPINAANVTYSVDGVLPFLFSLMSASYKMVINAKMTRFSSRFSQLSSATVATYWKSSITVMI